MVTAHPGYFAVPRRFLPAAGVDGSIASCGWVRSAIGLLRGERRRTFRKGS